MRVSLFAAALVIACGATPLRAEYSRSLHNDFGRWIGYGWSEGYHAYDECPPPCRPPMHLKWQPLVRPKSAWPVPSAAPWSPEQTAAPPREELPPPLPAAPAIGTEPSSILKRAIPQRQALKPSEQARPGEVPSPRGMNRSQSDVLPTSAVEIVSPPPLPDRYPLAR